ncbi:flagellar hook-associated protein 3 [Desulfosarcina widdelii]|uniref:Flagellar hook-associated protein 3 n=1 Tax=Desulfosarcina widdelii TaxID=947919 RepID=A0A5K7Z2E0_9BACT|nr:flagellar hook-associated protein FlgL [Desulfosarcina widdelii]BBO73691.1 flagellar hook-associated protein 3 [Desulfosarcina widdelii]
MRVSSRIMAAHIKSYLAKQSTALIETQTQISTGKKINSLSDAPGDIGKVLDYRTTLSKIEQYQENITDAKTRVEYTETVLGQINDLVNDAQTIASNPDTENREALALQVANIRDQIAGMVNTKYAGSYLFHGDLTDTAPFDVATGAYDASPGSDGSNSVMVGEDIQITLKADGSDMFIESGDNLIEVLDDLEAALLADDDVAIAATVDPLYRIDDQLELVRSEFSAAYNRLEATDERWTSFSNAVETMRSEIEDTDITAAAVDLQLQQTHYEVLLNVAAQVIQPTLMDFL